MSQLITVVLLIGFAIIFTSHLPFSSAQCNFLFDFLLHTSIFILSLRLLASAKPWGTAVQRGGQLTQHPSWRSTRRRAFMRPTRSTCCQCRVARHIVKTWLGLQRWPPSLVTRRAAERSGICSTLHVYPSFHLLMHVMQQQQQQLLLSVLSVRFVIKPKLPYFPDCRAHLIKPHLNKYTFFFRKKSTVGWYSILVFGTAPPGGWSKLLWKAVTGVDFKAATSTLIERVIH